jgi:ADP-ribose pyrophosphatase
MSEPPPLPAIKLSITEDYTAQSKCDEGYLRIKRRKMRARYSTGEDSEEFKYDVVERWNQDAVAILLHFVRNGERHIILRSAIRPPLALRDDLIEGAARAAGVERGELWEIPAGLVEKDERNPEGIVMCAVRETQEEVALTIKKEHVRALGGPVFPSAGIIGECIFLFEAEVSADKRPEPVGDGALEKHAKVIEVPLSVALDWCDRGLLPDSKTELAIRRFAARK